MSRGLTIYMGVRRRVRSVAELYLLGVELTDLARDVDKGSPPRLIAAPFFLDITSCARTKMEVIVVDMPGYLLPRD